MTKGVSTLTAMLLIQNDGTTALLLLAAGHGAWLECLLCVEHTDKAPRACWDCYYTTDRCPHHMYLSLEPGVCAADGAPYQKALLCSGEVSCCCHAKLMHAI